MKLDNLEKIAEKMYEDNIRIICFNYNYGMENLKIFFFNLDEKILIITKENIDIFVKVKLDNFYINTTLKGTNYKNLIKLINIKFKEEGPFKPYIFFKNLNDNFPNFEDLNFPKIGKNIKYIEDDIDDISKRNHLSFKEHKNGSNVSTKNLNKTFLFLGKFYYEKCKKCNMSSTWTYQKK